MPAAILPMAAGVVDFWGDYHLIRENPRLPAFVGRGSLEDTDREVNQERMSETEGQEVQIIGGFRSKCLRLKGERCRQNDE